MRRDLLLALAGAVSVVGAVLAYGRVFSDDAWRGPVLLAVVLATMLAVALRAVRLHPAATAGISLVGLVLASYVLLLESGPLIPGPTQLHELWALGWQGIDLLTGQLAPVPAQPGLVLLVLLGTWVGAHITHEVIVRTNVGAIGLAAPAALWIVPVSIPVEAPRIAAHTVPFLLGAVAYLLATSDHDVMGWASDRPGPRISPSGAGIGVLAVVIATAIPLTALGHGADAWIDVTGGSDPRGYQPIVDVGDRLKLPEPVDLLQVEAEQPSYLRIAALETFDGTSWRIGPASETSFRPSPDDLFRATEALPPEVPITGRSRTFTTSVEVLELENIYVPVPYQPISLSGDAAGDMVYSREGGFVATANLTDEGPEEDLRVGVTPGVAYEVLAVTPAPSYEELAGAAWTPEDLEGRVELPRPYPGLAQVARQVWTEADATSTIDRVLALQDWFIGPDSPFQYSTDVPDLRGDDALQRFVLESRVGYCEYFATAMAVMLRTAGIPARVSVGFLPGRLSEEAAFRDRNVWIVSSRDAHAWVEVLFPGVGWVKFDPTPRSDGATFVPTADNLNPTRSLAELGETPDQQASEQPTDAQASASPVPTDGPAADGEQPSEQAAGSGQNPDRGLPLWALVVIGLLLAASAIVLFAAWADHRPAATDPVGRVLVAQGRVHDEARRLGFGRGDAETTHEAAARFAREGRGEPKTLWRLADLSAAAAFREHASEPEADEAEQLSRLALRQMRSSSTRSARAMRPLRQPWEMGQRLWSRTWTRAWQTWEQMRG